MSEQSKQLKKMFPFLSEEVLASMAQPAPTAAAQPATVEPDAVPLPGEARPDEATRSPARSTEPFKPVDARYLNPKMFGPVPEYSVSQLARPVGALAGIFEEVGKIMVEAGAQGLEAVESAGDVIREKVGMEREPLS
ncbi:MAG: hypothetical protein GY918_12270, partial [Gammaproteobacteria bacterium]|nr:hypothetical protein [Gammaproteobacteria bacterium]